MRIHILLPIGIRGKSEEASTDRDDTAPEQGQALSLPEELPQ